MTRPRVSRTPSGPESLGCEKGSSVEDRNDDPLAHWFEPIAEHLGSAYLRYSFTKGTVQEVDHIVAALGLRAGERVLDVGCGPGRHAHELARRGVRVHGIDVSQRFVDLAVAGAPAGATFERLDARAVTFAGEFDAGICLCQGAFGLMTADGDDGAVVAGIACALRPGGRLALSAFNAYFAVRYHLTRGAPPPVVPPKTDDSTDGDNLSQDSTDGDIVSQDANASGSIVTFDAGTGVSHERTEVRDPDGRPLPVDLWTGCYTPRELRLLLAANGLDVERISSVEPGAYGDDPPTTETPEFLVIARRP